MGFLDDLRMANIFGGSKPFGMPDLTAGGFNPDTIRESLNMAIPAINAARTRDVNNALQLQSTPLGAGSNPHLDRVAQMGQMAASGPQNVKWDAANDSASEQNVQKRALLDQKTDLANNKLALGDRGLDIKQDQGDRKLDQADTNLGIKQNRADTYDYQIHNPIGKIVSPKGGTIQTIDPRTGLPKNSGVSTGTMSDKDAEAARQKDKLQQIDATGLNNANNQSIHDSAVTARDKDKKSTKSPSAMTPFQQRVQYNTNATKLMNTDSELGKFVHKNADGTFGIDSPSDGYFGHSGPTKEQFDTIKKAIYGDDLSAQPGEQSNLPDPAGIRSLIKPKGDDEDEE